MAADTPKFTSITANVDLTDTDTNPSAAPTATPRQGGFVLRNRIDFSEVAAASKSIWTIASAELTGDAIYNFRVLEVPERVFVKGVKVFAIKDATPPTFSCVGAKASNASITASDMNLSAWCFGADKNKKPTSSASYAAATHLVTATTVNAEADDGAGAIGGSVFGQAMLNMVEEVGTGPGDVYASSEVNLQFTDRFQTIDSSIANPLEPMQSALKLTQPGSTDIEDPLGDYFPYGGFVNMKLGPWNTSLASDAAEAAGYYAASTAAVISLAGVWEIQAECQYVPE